MKVFLVSTILVVFFIADIFVSAYFECCNIAQTIYGPMDFNWVAWNKID